MFKSHKIVNIGIILSSIMLAFITFEINNNVLPRDMVLLWLSVYYVCHLAHFGINIIDVCSEQELIERFRELWCCMFVCGQTGWVFVFSNDDVYSTLILYLMISGIVKTVIHIIVIIIHEFRETHQLSDKSVRYSQLSNEDKDEECCICKEDYTRKDKLVKLDCRHYFHQECQKSWMERSQTCPVCRVEIV